MIRKSYMPFFVCLFICTVNYGQAPQWSWAKGIAGTGNFIYNNLPGAVCTDANGNVYATGGFITPTIVLGNVTLTNPGTNSNSYIVKYDASGNVLWAQSMGGYGGVSSHDMCCDAAGNIYITGTFGGSATFGTINLYGSNDVFIAKYDSAGNVVWVKKSGGNAVPGMKDGTSIELDAAGNIYVAGYYSTPFITFDNYYLSALTSNDIFIVKYNSQGTVQWARGEATDSYYCGNKARIQVDGEGNVYLVGNFEVHTLTVGSNTLSNANTMFTVPDALFVKYDSNGNVLWAQRAGGTALDVANGINIDAEGNIYVTGYFESQQITFGQITLTNTSSTGDLADIFIAKYDAAGNVLWAKSGGGTSYDLSFSSATEPNGSTYIFGHGSSPSISFDSLSLSNTGSIDIFITKYSSSGNAEWVKGATGAKAENTVDMDIDNMGNCIVTGSFRSKHLYFDNAVIDNSNNENTYDIYIAKLGDLITNVSYVIAANSLLVSPNPATDQLIVQSSEFKVESVEVYDVLGQRVFNSSLISHNSSLTVDVSQWQAGIYVVRVRSDEEVFTEKVVISR